MMVTYFIHIVSYDVIISYIVCYTHTISYDDNLFYSHLCSKIDDFWVSKAYLLKDKLY